MAEKYQQDHRATLTALLALVCSLPGLLFAQTAAAAAGDPLFEPIRSVLQSPRCQNCHIPGDSPLQFDIGKVHAQNVKRGTDGKGMPGMMCSTCHQTQNASPSMGEHAPPGAPHWQLPPANMKMVFIGLSPHDLCVGLRDPKHNGGRSLQDLVHHFGEDQLVAWGWNPGAKRTPPPLTKAQTVAAVKAWVAAGAPCPGE